MSDDEYECPLCDITGSALADVYTHMMTSHRKSELSNALLETRGVRVENPDSPPP